MTINGTTSPAKALLDYERTKLNTASNLANVSTNGCKAERALGAG